MITNCKQSPNCLFFYISITNQSTRFIENLSIFKVITEQAFNASHHELALQLGVLLIAIIISFLVKQRWQRLIEKHIADAKEHIPHRNIALRATKRLSFSLSLSVLILVAYGIFDLFGHTTGIFYLAGPLVIILATIRILVFLLQVAAGPGLSNRSIEFTVSLSLWVFFALYLVDWLPNTNAFFNGIAITFGKVRISLLSVIEFLLISALLLLLAMALSRFLEIRWAKKEHLIAMCDLD